MGAALNTTATQDLPPAAEKEDEVHLDSSEEVIFPEGGLQAWLTLLGAFSAMFCTFGYISTWAVYQSYYYDTVLHGTSRSQIAWIGSLQAFFICVVGLISGPLMDRYGTKLILVPFSLLYITSVMLTSVSNEYYHFILAQGVLGGFSIGMLYTPSISILGHYFYRRRDLAIGIASSGSPFAGVVFPIALVQMLQHTNVGFGWSVRAIGLILFVFLAIACLTLKPRISPRRGPHFLVDAWKNPVFVFQVAGYCLTFWGIYTPFFFLPSFAIEKGVSVDWSFYIMPMFNCGSFIGRIVCSRLTFYIGRYNTVLISIIISGIMTFCWVACTSLASILVFSVIFGFFSGAMIGLFPTTIAMTAPHPNQIGTYIGMTMGCVGLFCLTGSPMMGAIVATYDSFTPAIVLSGVFIMVGATLLFFARWKHAAVGITNKLMPTKFSARNHRDDNIDQRELEDIKDIDQPNQDDLEIEKALSIPNNSFLIAQALRAEESGVSRVQYKALYEILQTFQDISAIQNLPNGLATLKAKYKQIVTFY
ncbi:hypothetical protein FQN57_006178 [Myotisia sp. PD_48]|nr:hypothetical protein FQN57_006178 [Myotisia sp. PD_48]